MYEDKYCIPVYYEGRTYYVAECIRKSLLQDFKDSNPFYELKVWDREHEEYLRIRMDLLSF